MTWVAVGTTAVGVVGAGLSASAAGSAANKQSDAAAAANALQKQQYDDTVQRNQPFVQGGTDAFNALLGRLGLGSASSSSPGYGTLGKVPTAADVMATPGFQFGLDQGQNQLNRQLNARGMSYSGAQLKAADQYGTNYATTKYDDAFNNLQSSNQQAYNQLAGVAGIGQASANGTAAAGAQYATQAGNNLTGSANAQAAGQLSANNAYVGALNQGVSAYKSSYGGGGLNSNGSMSSNSAYYTDPSSYGAQNGSDVGMSFADGGPVRSEPVVGSRSALPGGTGGGMSKDAIIAALLARQQTMDQGRSGVGALPANPLMNPRAILANRLQQAGDYAWGGAVHGPGGPKDDAIPANLSNGEHVIDEAAVTGLGGGSNERGQNMLNAKRKQWRAH